jgi:hypothetical protein
VTPVLISTAFLATLAHLRASNLQGDSRKVKNYTFLRACRRIAHPAAKNLDHRGKPYVAYRPGFSTHLALNGAGIIRTRRRFIFAAANIAPIGRRS